MFISDLCIYNKNLNLCHDTVDRMRLSLILLNYPFAIVVFRSSFKFQG